jgi:hypothetical protein
MDIIRRVQDVVRARVNDAAWAWLTGTPLDRGYTSAPLRVGRAPLALTDAERQDLAAVAPGLSFAAWTIDDAARCALLLQAAAQLDAGAFADAATACYERGDSREQQSWLRAISLLPDAERFLSIAIDACRTNIVPVFESIACENPYPARCFPDRNFNQLVLKALFNGVAIARIAGLSERANAELARMAGDYADERRAAGRAVPADIALAMRAGRAAEELAR